MIFEELTKRKVSDIEKAQIISKGINAYRRKILDTFFPEGVPYSEVPFFIAALNLTLKDMRDIARRENNLENCIGAAREAARLTNLCTETITFINRKGEKNG